MSLTHSSSLLETNNKTGYMLLKLDEICQKFVEYSASCSHPVLDIGCAYGVATHAALEVGAKVYATDVDSIHLDVLKKNTNKNHLQRLKCLKANILDNNFQSNFFEGILCSRVLHFLNGEEVETALDNIVNWLRPNGKVFISTETVYSALWPFYIEEFENRKKNGEKWPGLFHDYNQRVSAPENPGTINLLDPSILFSLCVERNLKVEYCNFSNRRGIFPDEFLIDGREAAIIVAQKC